MLRTVHFKNEIAHHILVWDIKLMDSSNGLKQMTASTHY